MRNYLLEYNGDLLETKLDFICHQCNCVSTSVSGLAYFINEKFPFANDCEEHKKGNFHSLGDLVVHRGDNGPIIFNIYGQYYPGFGGDKGDTQQERMAAFACALEKITRYVKSLKMDKPSIGFPCRIGSNLAGGDWSMYRKMIIDFSDSYHESTAGTVHIINKIM